MLGLIIKQKRIDKGLSIEDLSKKVEADPIQIHGLESGEIKGFSNEFMSKIIDFLGIEDSKTISAFRKSHLERTKKCTGCLQVKLLEDFDKRFHNSEKTVAKCKICRNSIKSKWNQENFEKVEYSRVKSYIKNKEYTLASRRENKKIERAEKLNHIIKQGLKAAERLAKLESEIRFPTFAELCNFEETKMNKLLNDNPKLKMLVTNIRTYCEVFEKIRPPVVEAFVIAHELSVLTNDPLELLTSMILETRKGQVVPLFQEFKNEYYEIRALFQEITPEYRVNSRGEFKKAFQLNVFRKSFSNLIRKQSESLLTKEVKDILYGGVEGEFSKMPTNKTKAVLCITNNTVYTSIEIASRQLNLYNSNIRSVINGRYKHTGGYSFRYLTDEELKTYNKKKESENV